TGSEPARLARIAASSARNAEKAPETAGRRRRVDSPLPRKFAPGVVRTLEAPRPLRAGLPLIGLALIVGCPAPPPPATATTAPRTETPVAGCFEPHTEGNGTKAQATSSAPEPAAPGWPERLPIAFTRHQLCEQGTCSLSGWLPDPSYADSPLEEIAAQAAIWVHVFGEQAKVTLPPNAALELLV